MAMALISSLGSRGGRIVAPLLLFLVAAEFIYTPGVQAQQGAIAIAGSFSQQTFEIPQGEKVSAPGVYVRVYNHSDESLVVQFRSTSPLGVQLLYSASSFALAPGKSRQVFVTVKVAKDAIPGEYDLVVAAGVAPASDEGVRPGTVGARLVTASAQRARLVVTGESASIRAVVVSLEGHPIEAKVRLSKVIQDRSNEVAYSETGELAATVSPGRYNISAHLGARTLGEESLEIRAGESREVTLSVGTVFFEHTGIEPDYESDTGELASVRVAYTLNNLYEPVNDAEVVLQVDRDGVRLERITLISLGRLDLGRTEGVYNYVPTGGWREGRYEFELKLYVEESHYVDSPVVKTISVTIPLPSVDRMESMPAGELAALLERGDPKETAEAMDQLTPAKLIETIPQMTESSLIQVLPLIPPRKLFWIPPELLFDALPNAPVEMLVGGVQPEVAAEFSSPVLVGATDTRWEHRLPRTPAGEWALATESPDSAIVFLINTADALQDVAASIEFLADRPDEVTVIPDPGAQVYRYFSLDQSIPEDVSWMGHIEFAVEKAWVDSESIHRWAVDIYRYDAYVNQWIRLPSKRVHEDASRIYYTAEVPGENSVFAIAGGELPVPEGFMVSDLLVTPDEVEAGDPVTVTATVSDTSGKTGYHVAVLWINGAMAAAKVVAVPADGTATVTFQTAADALGEYEVRIGRSFASLSVGGAGGGLPVQPWVLLIGAVFAVALLYLFIRYRLRVARRNSPD